MRVVFVDRAAELRSGLRSAALLGRAPSQEPYSSSARAQRRDAQALPCSSRAGPRQSTVLTLIASIRVNQLVFASRIGWAAASAPVGPSFNLPVEEAYLIERRMKLGKPVKGAHSLWLVGVRPRRVECTQYSSRCVPRSGTGSLAFCWLFGGELWCFSMLRDVCGQSSPTSRRRQHQTEMGGDEH